MSRFYTLALVFCLSIFMLTSEGVSQTVNVTSPLSDKEAKIMNLAVKAANQNKWRTFRKYKKQIKSPLAQKTLDWVDYQNPNKKITFSKISVFIKNNPEWPLQNRLQSMAEAAMPMDISSNEVFLFFADNPPQNSDGRTVLATALLAVGKKQEAIDILRENWINGNFTKSREKHFYKRYRKYLTADDNLKRLERLLWDGKSGPARRMLWRVPKDYRSLAEARIALRMRRGNVDRLIKNVPTKFKKDHGLLFERLRWRRRKGLDTAFDLAAKIPENVTHPKLWSREQANLSRKALQKGHITTAYLLASKHSLTEGSDLSELEWFAGWIAHSFLGDHEIALGHFKAMYEAVNYPVSKARGAYWAGRAAAALGQKQKALEWYKIAAEFVNTYYGQLSFLELGPGSKQAIPPSIKISAKHRAEFDSHELVKVVNILSGTNDEKFIKHFILALRELSDEPYWQALTGELARKINRPDIAITVAKRAVRKGTYLSLSGYPIINLPSPHKRTKTANPEDSLIHALIRQESSFKVDAMSPVKARGMMQLMPRTAQLLAKQLRITYKRDKLIRDANYNITLGQHYLSELLNRYNGSYVLALTAYNAGPSRVKRWIKSFGDPRLKDVDTIDWIELIPFGETRNYVQRVLENVQVYRRKLKTTEVAMTIAEDLH